MTSALRAVALAGLVASSAAFAQLRVVNGYPYLRSVVPGTDICLAWGTRTIVYNVDTAGSVQTPNADEFDAIDASFATWQAISTSCSDMQFIKGALIGNAPVGYNPMGGNQNVVVFREVACRDAVPLNDPCTAAGTCANTYRCWEYPDFTIGVTTTTFNNMTGAILDGDIELNASQHADGTSFLFTTVNSPPCPMATPTVNCVATDVQNTMTHELGHLVGLNHVTPDDMMLSSVMEASASIGETVKRIADPGTTAGFCDTYPKNLPATTCDDLGLIDRRIVGHNRGVPGCTCGSAGGFDVGAGLVLLLGAAYIARRHARSHPRRRSAGQASA